MNIGIVGYGNSIYQDDGLGPALIDRLKKDKNYNLTLLSKDRLLPEDSLEIATSDVVIFVDASLGGIEPFSFYEIPTRYEVSFSSDLFSPQMILSLRKCVSDMLCRGYMLAIRGYEFDIGKKMSIGANVNLRSAYAFIHSLIVRHTHGDSSNA